MAADWFDALSGPEQAIWIMAWLDASPTADEQLAHEIADRRVALFRKRRALRSSAPVGGEQPPAAMPVQGASPVVATTAAAHSDAVRDPGTDEYILDNGTLSYSVVIRVDDGTETQITAGVGS